MRSSEATSSAPRRVGTRLLLALALCACGQGGGDAGGGGARADSAGPQAARAAAPGPVPDSCLPPPPPITPVAGQAWTDLVNQISKSGLTFPDSAGNNSVRAVALCPECDTVSLQLRASRSTCGVDTVQASAAVLPLGLMIPQRDVPAAHQWGDLRRGDTLFLFSPGKLDGPALVAYRQKDPATGVDRVALAPEGAWAFFFCRDAHVPPRRSEWRNRDSIPGNGGNPGGGSYGWMACISGCCQFYTPPGDGDTPPQASDKAPDTVGRGRNQGRFSERPRWCPTAR